MPRRSPPVATSCSRPGTAFLRPRFVRIDWLRVTELGLLWIHLDGEAAGLLKNAMGQAGRGGWRDHSKFAAPNRCAMALRSVESVLEAIRRLWNSIEVESPPELQAQLKREIDETISRLKWRVEKCLRASRPTFKESIPFRTGR